MTQEEIQKAAMAYAWKGKAKDVESIFRIAANWRINSVWHSAQDMPSRNMKANGMGEWCLVENEKGYVDLYQAQYESGNRGYYFSTSFTETDFPWVVRWAYVKDLMPTEE